MNDSSLGCGAIGLDAESLALIGGPPDRVSPLDKRLRMTRLPDVLGQVAETYWASLRQLEAEMQRTKARDKGSLGLFSGARFGTVRSSGGALRHDSNVKGFGAIVLDYDGNHDAGALGPTEVAEMFRAAGLAALIATTSSHGSPEKPNAWRVVLPLSGERPPGEHAELVARASGVLGPAPDGQGRLDDVSFTRSQSFYIGHTGQIETFLVDGRYLDAASDLASPALGKRQSTDGDVPTHTGEKTGLDWDVFRAAVMSIPNDGSRPEHVGRDWWLKIVASVNHESDGSAEGLELAHEWSALWPGYDVARTDQVWRSFKNRPGQRQATGATVLAEARKHGWTEYIPELCFFDDDVAPDLSSSNIVPGRLTFTTPDQCAELPPLDYVWKHMLAPGDLACIVGAPGAGKSLLAPLVGYMVALGAKAFGKRVRAGLVFYVAAEDEAGMKARVAALRERHGSTDSFVIVGGVGDLFSDKSPDLLELRRAVTERRPALIIIDTFSMAFPGVDENEAKSMQHVVKVGRSLTKHGAAVILVHHTTKDGGSLPRGSGVLNGALDMSLHVEAAGQGIVRGKLTKNRRGPAGQALAFKIAVRRVGTDADGQAVEAALAEPTDLDTVATGRTATKAGRAALDVLARLGGASRKPVEMARWRKACAEEAAVTAAEKPDDRRKAVTRIVGSLARNGFVDVRDDMVSRATGIRAEDEFGDDDVIG